MQRYGEEKIIRHVLDGAPLDAEQADLVDDWTAWLKDHYGSYTQVAQNTTTRNIPQLPAGKSSE